MQRKRRTEQLSLQNCRVMKLEFINTDLALKGHAGQLKELTATKLDRKQRRLTICGQRMQRRRKTEQRSLENGRFLELKFTMNYKAPEDLARQLKELNATSILPM